jgi:hypothetical protein
MRGPTHRPTAGNRVLALVLLALVCLSGLAPVATATATTATSGPAETHERLPTAFEQIAPDNQTTSSGPTLAEQVRITPVKFDRDYLRVRPGDAPNTYRTVGPYVVFATSLNVEAATIEQPGATATVMDGSRTIRVAYQPDAATGDEPSLYTLTLYFADDSKRTIKLYATRTNQIVASAELKAASEFIEQMKEDAKAHGFPTTIEGIEEYHEWEREQADIFSNFLGPELERLFVFLISYVRSSLAVILSAVVAIIIGFYIKRAHGYKIEDMVNGGNATERKRRDYASFYEGQHSSAASEALHAVDEIGTLYEGFILDAFGDRTVKQWADRWAYGEPLCDETGAFARDDDGNIRWKHRGIDDLLEADNLRETALEPLLRHEMIGDEQTVLMLITAALERLTDHYSLRQYDDPAQKARTLLEQHSDSLTESVSTGGSWTGTSRHGGAVGGDD